MNKMEQYDVSFLLQGDRNLNVLTKYWHDPVFLISPYLKNFNDLFIPKDQEGIGKLAEKAFDNVGSFICGDGYQIQSPKVAIALCMVTKNDRIFMLGMNSEIFNNIAAGPRLKDMIQRFMSLIISTERDLMTDNIEIIHSQFEEIQKLNNQLVNIQRQLQKSNAQLNQLNSDLNNRLVKDELTGLVSRYQYREEIEMTIAKNPDRFGVFVFLDLDGFKKVNDTFGHRAGDNYLKEFGRRLKGLTFENFIAMRISGDEFGLYIHGYDHVGKEEYIQIWKRIEEQVLSKPLMIEYQELDVRCSGGMSVYGIHSENFFDLIEYADFAMYEAKNSTTELFKTFNRERYNQKKIPVSEGI